MAQLLIKPLLVTIAATSAFLTHLPGDLLQKLIFWTIWTFCPDHSNLGIIDKTFASCRNLCISGSNVNQR